MCIDEALCSRVKAWISIGSPSSSAGAKGTRIARRCCRRRSLRICARSLLLAFAPAARSRGQSGQCRTAPRAGAQVSAGTGIVGLALGIPSGHAEYRSAQRCAPTPPPVRPDVPPRVQARDARHRPAPAGNPHGLRHAFATHLRRAGHDIGFGRWRLTCCAGWPAPQRRCACCRTVRELLGHSDFKGETALARPPAARAGTRLRSNLGPPCPSVRASFRETTR